MGNFSYIVRRGKLSTKTLAEATRATNDEVFGGVFEIEEWDDGLRIGLDGEFWFDWQRESGGKFGGKYPRQGSVGTWVHFRFLNQVAARCKAKISYEFIKGSEEPEPDLFPTYRAWYLHRTEGAEGAFLVRVMSHLAYMLDFVPTKLRPYINGPLE